HRRRLHLPGRDWTDLSQRHAPGNTHLAGNGIHGIFRGIAGRGDLGLYLRGVPNPRTREGTSDRHIDVVGDECADLCDVPCLSKAIVSDTVLLLRRDDAVGLLYRGVYLPGDEGCFAGEAGTKARRSRIATFQSSSTGPQSAPDPRPTAHSQGSRQTARTSACRAAPT